MSKPVKIALALLVVVVAVGGFLFWFLQDDAPDEVDLGDAVDAVEDDGAGDGSTGEPVSIEGTWVVDTEQGTFDYSDTASGTFVGFRVDEELTGVGAATAVGRTPEVTGELAIEGTTLSAADFTANLAAITTNESRRDGRVRGALSTDQFPEATFTLTEPVDLGDAAADGGPVAVTADGELTIKGITQPVTIEIEAQLTGSTMVVVGSTEITFADWDVEVPSAPVVLSAEDTGILEVQLLLTQG